MRNENAPSRPDSPLARWVAAARLRRCEILAASGLGERAYCRLLRGDASQIRVGKLAALAVALGVAPTELVPELLKRPRGGLLQDAGVVEPPGTVRKLRATRGGSGL